jgi:hypothetical protein
MMKSDISRKSYEEEWREADRKRIEMEMKKEKREMESEELMERIDDNK